MPHSEKKRAASNKYTVEETLNGVLKCYMAMILFYLCFLVVCCETE